MPVLLMIFLILFRFVAMANVLIYFAQDYKSTPAIIWAVLLIVSTIGVAISEKTAGRHFSTVFDKPIPHIVLNGILLIITVVMYLPNKDRLGILYLLIFGSTFVSQIYLNMKLVRLPTNEKQV